MLRGGSLTWGACSPQGKPGGLAGVHAAAVPALRRNAGECLDSIRVPPGRHLLFRWAGCPKSTAWNVPKGPDHLAHRRRKKRPDRRGAGFPAGEHCRIPLSGGPDYPFGRRLRLTVVLINATGNGGLKRSAPVNRGRHTYIQNVLCTNWLSGHRARNWPFGRLPGFPPEYGRARLRCNRDPAPTGVSGQSPGCVRPMPWHG
jgi:hypothetical protein